MFFELQATDRSTRARAGLIHTDHGTIETPIFMPVGTKATVKAVSQELLLNEIQAQIILGNTYHLYLRPGADVIEGAGGLHRFMNWNRPILTDSGGYQVFSLSPIRKIKEEGIEFSSHIDGSKHLFTPTNVVDKQRSIGSDIMMTLDECTPFPCEYAYASKSMGLTHRWAKQAREYFLETQPKHGYQQAQFGIIQGSVYKDLRKASAEEIVNLDFEGNAIGGLAVGEPAEMMYELTDYVVPFLPEHKPRYLMGVGTPVNILESWALGIDMMDCVMPTRNARHGLLFTWEGKMNLHNAKYKNDYSPIDENSSLSYDRNFSKAYLRHLLNAQEILGYIITSVHNLYFYLELSRVARQKILEGNFGAWKNEMVAKLDRKL